MCRAAVDRKIGEDLADHRLKLEPMATEPRGDHYTLAVGMQPDCNGVVLYIVAISIFKSEVDAVAG